MRIKYSIHSNPNLFFPSAAVAAAAVFVVVGFGIDHVAQTIYQFDYCYTIVSYATTTFILSDLMNDPYHTHIYSMTVIITDISYSNQ